MHLILRSEDHVRDNETNAFDKSVRSAPSDFLLPVADFHFSSIGISTS